MLAIQGETPLDFGLEFPFFKAIDKKHSLEKPESAGVMLLHLKKKERGVWKRLFDTNFDDSHLRWKIWWELADIYPRPMQRYNQLIDKEEDLKKGKQNAQKAEYSGQSSNIYTREQRDEMKKRWVKWLSSFS